MHTSSDDFLSPNDLISVTALVEHLEYKKGFDPKNAFYLLKTEFGVSDVKHIKRCDFDRAVAFLVDLQEMTVQ